MLLKNKKKFRKQFNNEDEITALIIDDKKYCWHPFTQEQTSATPLLISSAKGSYIYDIENTPYLDAISSWWVNTHGHNHEYITKAISTQAQNLAHVIFSGITHPCAIKFAKLLAKNLPNNTEHIFYTDNGSTAIEAALKMAIQYAYNNNQNYNKNTFLAFEGAYHGDTFGAMSVGKTSGFYTPFKQWLFNVDFVDYPCINLNSDIENIVVQENIILNKLLNYLSKNHNNIAAFIFEPLVQGASGMRMCRVDFLNKVLEICKQYNIICIADEVMTGFGRTGKLFACEYLNNQPDIICLSKGITGGTLPLGVVATNSKIYNAFLDDNIMHAFLHGHSYTANPIICAAALANLEIFVDNKQQIFEHIQNISKIYIEQLNLLKNKLNIHLNINLNSVYIKNLRVMGAICAFDIEANTSKNIKYGSNLGQIIRLEMLKKQVIIRPLGNTIYILPPYCITIQEIENLFIKIYDVLSKINTCNDDSILKQDLF